MKIRRIKLLNNPIFGNDVEFDFTGDDGSTYNNIRLIGENGSGKSQLLEVIFEFSKLGSLQNKGNEKREIEVEFTKHELLKVKNFFLVQNKLYNPQDNILILKFDYEQQYQLSLESSDGKQVTDMSHGVINNILSNTEMVKIFKSIYSTSEITFTASKIKGTTNLDIDNQNSKSKKSPTDLANIIAQLLVDIRNKDNEEDISYSEKNGGKLPIKKQIRSNRFKKAFEIIFGKELFYQGIKNNTPYFTKGKKDFEINGLSSGEKQIVFRGGYLLQDKNTLIGAPVLIDEPEISLHPKRQLNIVNFYRELFSEKGTQESQIFITTHSPYILRNYDNQVKIISMKRDTTGVVVNNLVDVSKLFNVSSRGEVNYIGYQLPTIEYHDDLYGYLHSQFIDSGSTQKEKNIRSSQTKFETDFLFKRKEISIKSKMRNKERGLIPDKKGGKNVTLQTFIRHKTHHPENRTMQPHDFTIKELEKSINEMQKIIANEGYKPIL